MKSPEPVVDESEPALEHNVQRTAPERIYLQTGDDPLDMSVSFSELMSMGDVSWCQDKVFEADVPYVRADLHPAPCAETERDAAWKSSLKELPEPMVDVLCRYILHTGEQYKVMCINADGEWQGYDDLNPKGEIVTHWKYIDAAMEVKK